MAFFKRTQFMYSISKLAYCNIGNTGAKNLANCHFKFLTHLKLCKNSSN